MVIKNRNLDIHILCADDNYVNFNLLFAGKENLKINISNNIKVILDSGINDSSFIIKQLKANNIPYSYGDLNTLNFDSDDQDYLYIKYGNTFILHDIDINDCNLVSNQLISLTPEHSIKLISWDQFFPMNLHYISDGVYYKSAKCDKDTNVLQFNWYKLNTELEYLYQINNDLILIKYDKLAFEEYKIF